MLLSKKGNEYVYMLTKTFLHFRFKKKKKIFEKCISKITNTNVK